MNKKEKYAQMSDEQLVLLLFDRPVDPVAFTYIQKERRNVLRQHEYLWRLEKQLKKTLKSGD